MTTVSQLNLKILKLEPTMLAFKGMIFHLKIFRFEHLSPSLLREQLVLWRKLCCYPISPSGGWNLDLPDPSPCTAFLCTVTLLQMQWIAYGCFSPATEIVFYKDKINNGWTVLNYGQRLQKQLHRIFLQVWANLTASFFIIIITISKHFLCSAFTRSAEATNASWHL